LEIPLHGPLALLLEIIAHGTLPVKRSGACEYDRSDILLLKNLLIEPVLTMQ
jgi:hypothetical protein